MRAVGVVKVWDAVTLKELFEMKGLESPWCLAFSPDGQHLFTAGADQSLKIWDIADDKIAKLLATLPGHADDIRGLAVSPNGQRVVSASEDHTLKLWDVATGQEMLTLRGHTDFVGAVAFSSDGNRIASASNDGTIKIWDGTPRDNK